MRAHELILAEEDAFDDGISEDLCQELLHQIFHSVEYGKSDVSVEGGERAACLRDGERKQLPHEEDPGREEVWIQWKKTTE